MNPTDKQMRDNVLEFTQRQDGEIEQRLLRWIIGISRSNDRLITVLERLRESYTAIVLETNAKGSSELLLQVERALVDGRKARVLVMADSVPENQGA